MQYFSNFILSCNKIFMQVSLRSYLENCAKSRYCYA